MFLELVACNQQPQADSPTAKSSLVASLKIFHIKQKGMEKQLNLNKMIKLCV